MIEGDNIIAGVARSATQATPGVTTSVLFMNGITIPMLIQLATLLLVVVQAAYWVTRFIRYLRGQEMPASKQTDKDDSP